MKVEKVFLIYDNPSDYESYQRVIGFVFTEEEAKHYVKRETELYNQAELLSEKLNTERIKFDAILSPLILEERLLLPKWAPGIGEGEITIEMREERDSINLENELRRDRNNIKYLERSKIIYSHLFKFLQSYFSENNFENSMAVEQIEKYMKFDSEYGYIGLNNAEFLKSDKPFFYESTNLLK